MSEGYVDEVKFQFAVESGPSAVAVLEQLATAVEATQKRISGQFMEMVATAERAAATLSRVNITPAQAVSPAAVTYAGASNATTSAPISAADIGGALTRPGANTTRQPASADPNQGIFMGSIISQADTIQTIVTQAQTAAHDAFSQIVGDSREAISAVQSAVTQSTTAVQHAVVDTQRAVQSFNPNVASPVIVDNTAIDLAARNLQNLERQAETASTAVKGAVTVSPATAIEADGTSPRQSPESRETQSTAEAKRDPEVLAAVDHAARTESMRAVVDQLIADAQAAEEGAKSAVESASEATIEGVQSAAEQSTAAVSAATEEAIAKLGDLEQAAKSAGESASQIAAPAAEGGKPTNEVATAAPAAETAAAKIDAPAIEAAAQKMSDLESQTNAATAAVEKLDDALNAPKPAAEGAGSIVDPKEIERGVAAVEQAKAQIEANPVQPTIDTTEWFSRSKSLLDEFEAEVKSASEAAAESVEASSTATIGDVTSAAEGSAEQVGTAADEAREKLKKLYKEYHDSAAKIDLLPNANAALNSLGQGVRQGQEGYKPPSPPVDIPVVDEAALHSIEALNTKVESARDRYEELSTASDKAGQMALRHAEKMTAAHERTATGIMSLIRGVTILGALGEGTSKETLEKIAKVQGVIDTVMGAANVAKGVATSWLSYRAAITASNEAQKQQQLAAQAASQAVAAEGELFQKLQEHAKKLAEDLGKESEAAKQAAASVEALARARANAANQNYTGAAAKSTGTAQVDQALNKTFEARKQELLEMARQTSGRANGGGVVRGAVARARGALGGIGRLGGGMLADATGIGGIAGLGGVGAAVAPVVNALGIFGAAIGGVTLASMVVKEAITGEAYARNSLSAKIAENVWIAPINWVGKMTGLFDLLGDTAVDLAKKQASKFESAGAIRRDQASIDLEADSSISAARVSQQDKVHDAMVAAGLASESDAVGRKIVDRQLAIRQMETDRSNKTDVELNTSGAKEQAEVMKKFEEEVVGLRMQATRMAREEGRQRIQDLQAQGDEIKRQIDMQAKERADAKEDLMTAKERFANMSDEDKQLAIDAKKKLRTQGPLSLDDTEKDLLRRVGTEEDVKAAREGDVAEADRFGFDSFFGNDERRRIQVAEQVQKKLEVDLKQNYEITLKQEDQTAAMVQKVRDLVDEANREQYQKFIDALNADRRDRKAEAFRNRQSNQQSAK